MILFAGVVVLAVVCVFILCGIYCNLKKKRSIRMIAYDGCKSIDNLESDTKRKLKKNVDSYLYGLARYLSILVGKIPSMRIRKWFLRNIFAMELDKRCVIYGGCEFRSPWNIKLGRCIVGVGSILDGRNGIVIEDDVCLATEVYIWTEQHDVNDSYFRCNDKGGPVLLQSHSWLSSRTTILPNVTVGRGTVISCGAVVSKNCDNYGIYAGIPAKKMRERNHDLKYILGDEYWHFY